MNPAEEEVVVLPVEILRRLAERLRVPEPAEVEEPLWLASYHRQAATG